jgi:hypothetical protein
MRWGQTLPGLTPQLKNLKNRRIEMIWSVIAEGQTRRV